MKKSIIIGIAGGSASGKTSISRAIYEEFRGRHTIGIIRQDDYYKDLSHLTMEERKQVNYDHPLAFDSELLIEQMTALKNGQAINKPIYDFTQHNRSSLTETINPRDVFVLEGLFVLNDPQLRELCDILIYVDTDADIRFIRRLQRDNQQRGRSIDSIIQQYLSTVRVMHNTFIEPSKKYAHVIIPEGANNHVAIDLLITKIRSIVDKN